MTLLLIDRQEDPHADWVEAECQHREIPFFRWCTDLFPRDIEIAIRLQNALLQGTLLTETATLDLESVTGVWHRRPALPVFDPDITPEYVESLTQEAYQTTYGLAAALWDRRWVNPPASEFRAEHKIYQLRLAAHLGFTTVPTLVTNNPGEAQQFIQACGGRVIYKRLWTMGTTHKGNIYGTYATLIDTEEMLANRDAVRLSPCLFQQFVPKAYELRINVIGDSVWAAAIYSQDHEHTRIDFRTDVDGCRHEPIVVPTEIEALCRRLTHTMGLRMGNIDMIVTPEGDYIFLEINPNGQWAWIEDKVGFPLATALVDELLGVNTLEHHPYLKSRSLVFDPTSAIKGFAPLKV